MSACSLFQGCQMVLREKKVKNLQSRFMHYKWISWTPKDLMVSSSTNTVWVSSLVQGTPNLDQESRTQQILAWGPGDPMISMMLTTSPAEYARVGSCSGWRPCNCRHGSSCWSGDADDANVRRRLADGGRPRGLSSGGRLRGLASGRLRRPRGRFGRYQVQYALCFKIQSIGIRPGAI